MSQAAPTPSSDVLATRFAVVRGASEQLAAPLSPEDTTAPKMRIRFSRTLGLLLVLAASAAEGQGGSGAGELTSTVTGGR